MRALVLALVFVSSGCSSLKYCRPDDIHNQNCRPQIPQNPTGATSRGFSIKGVWEW
jgi:hypothetical protein